MKCTVYVIDDDLVSQFASVYCLEQADVNSSIVTCESAQEALNLLSAENGAKKDLPDIIFLDLVMPGMDGWEFLDKIKNINDGLQWTSIYILSAFANSKDRERAKDHPMIQGYFNKPLSQSILEKIFSPKIL